MTDDDTLGFESLDEPQAKQQNDKKRRFGPELIIGLVLLLGLAGWGGWDWLHQQSALSHYQAGERYASLKDWDAAQKEFQAAGDYADAKQQAVNSAELIEKRDAAYVAADAAISDQDWLNAVSHLRDVTAIQPNYHDSADLQKTATAQLYNEAISGTVASRLQADPPGLYLRTANSWVYLKDSDAKSQVLGYGDACCIVYDTPTQDPGATPVPTPQLGPGAGPLIKDGLLGRTVYVARHSGAGLSFSSLNVDMSEFSYANWNDKGIFSYSSDYSDRYNIDPRLYRERGFPPYLNWFFQGFDGSAPAAFVRSGPAVAILGNGPANSYTFIVGDYSNVRENPPETELYLSDYSGSASRLLAKRPASVIAAQLSPDQRYLLSYEYIALASKPFEEDRLVLVPLDGSAETVLLAVQLASSAAMINPPTTGMFVTFGSGATDVVMTVRTEQGSETRLVDPAQPNKVLWSQQAQPNESLQYTRSLGDGVLLLWGIGGRILETNTAVYIDPNYKAWPLKVLIPSESNLFGAWQYGDHIFYTYYSAVNEENTRWKTELRTLTLGAARSELVYSANQPAPYFGGVGPGFTWDSRQYAFVYIKDSQLHVRNYADSTDVVLEDGIGTLFGPPW